MNTKIVAVLCVAHRARDKLIFYIWESFYKITKGRSLKVKATSLNGYIIWQNTLKEI
ncbi:hypothetical protein HIO71_12235 [Chryseobacterium aquaticum]|uniref:Uncharacterized protein n=1 Tax=Chryseobacterium aquaticum TaxID=452084 RepID=A0A848N7N2_9FLAO|nr:MULTISPECIES: hypothetical protein [Chryseobacterium]NMR34955.1 hypothetical protein [Chryseobacterium aquaticum]NRQ47181.1 hypothetical protein [Chryseobacterium sp. C-204]